MSDSSKRTFGKRKDESKFQYSVNPQVDEAPVHDPEDVVQEQPASLLNCYVWPVVVEHAGSQYNVAYTDQSPIKAFLVPVGEFEPSTKKT